MPEGKGYTGSASDPKKGPVEAAQGGEVVKAGFGGAFRQSRRGRGGNRFRLGKGRGRGGSLVKQLRRRPGQGTAMGGSTLGPAKKGFGNATAGSFRGGGGAQAAASGAQKPKRNRLRLPSGRVRGAAQNPAGGRPRPGSRIGGR